LIFSVLVFINYRAKKQANIALEQKNTELNEAFIQLKSTQSQLIHSEKMASLGQLTAGIAHEINNPLNFVYAGIGALESNVISFYQITDLFQHILTEEDQEKIINQIVQLRKADTPKEYEELQQDINALIKDIKIGAVRTTEIVKGLRNFSRLDEGSPKLGDIHNDIDAALMLLRNKLAQNVTVSKKYGEKIPEISALHGQINQVFTNIIANAIQAMDKGGKITISTKMANREGKNYVGISIRDTGKGMPENIKARIFEPFYTTKDVGEGTGLGLSISYGIIRNHRGTIEVFSELGKGTEFIIYLPID
jgi:signal transduction histidine kinase